MGVVEPGEGQQTRPPGTLQRLRMQTSPRMSQRLLPPVAPILHLRLPMRHRFPRLAPMELTETFSTHGTRLRAKNDGAWPAAAPELLPAVVWRPQGNLVFSSVNNRLLAFRADNGDKVFDLDLGTTQMGPPISFTIDGKQYIGVTAGLAAAPGTGRGAPARAPHLFMLGLDGKTALP